MSRLGLIFLMGCAPTFATVIPDEVPEPDDPAPEVPNVPPVADAGVDQRVPVGTPIVLNGGSSHDPDGPSLRYLWEVVEAPAGSRASARGSGDAAAFDPDMVGWYEIQLTVTDADAATDIDTVTVESVDTWGDDGGRPAPGEVYLLGVVDGECRRGITALRASSRAYVGFDCRPELESVMVQVDGSFQWVDGATPREHACDGRCWISAPEQFPTGDVAANDPALGVPCPEEAVEVVLGPGRTLARCFSRQGVWVDEVGVVSSDTSWQPFAAGHGRLVLVRRQEGREVAVLDPDTGQVHATQPPLDWHFLRAWRAFEDGFRVAAYDAFDRTSLVEVDSKGIVTEVGTYAHLPPRTVVRVGSRLDSAGNLYVPVVVDRVSQVIRTEPDGDMRVLWDDSDDPLVKVGFGGELVTGP